MPAVIHDMYTMSDGREIEEHKMVLSSLLELGMGVCLLRWTTNVRGQEIRSDKEDYCLLLCCEF